MPGEGTSHGALVQGDLHGSPATTESRSFSLALARFASPGAAIQESAVRPAPGSWETLPFLVACEAVWATEDHQSSSRILILKGEKSDRTRPIVEINVCSGNKIAAFFLGG